MRLENNNGQVHIVHIEVETCLVRITRVNHPIVKLQFDLTISFLEGMRKIKNVVNLDDSLYDSIAEMTREEGI